MEQGPDGLRLQSIASDLGLSHSSILHHFGSRDGLLDALSLDALAVLEGDLKTSFETTTKDDPATDLFEKVARSLGERGYARLLAWQIMSERHPSQSDPAVTGDRANPDGGLLDRLARTLQSMRVDFARRRDQPAPTLDETRSIIAMTACMLFGEALAGEVMLRSAALPSDPASRRRFRNGLARDLEERIFPNAILHA